MRYEVLRITIDSSFILHLSYFILLPMFLVVIGGGAAGFFAAITAAECNPAAQVTLLERSPNVLGKVRISGGGRCNVTHACFDPATLITNYPRGSRELRGPFTRFQPRDTMQWFESRGVVLKTEADGRIFPISNNSATIVDCLIDAAKQAGVHIQTNVQVMGISVNQTPQAAETSDVSSDFTIELKDQPPLHADKLLLATGSNTQGYAWAKAMGHTLVPPVPSLFTFNIQDERLRELAGVAVTRASVHLVGGEGSVQTGPVLITHWGLSGPAVLRLSAWEARTLHTRQYQSELRVNWLADWHTDDVIERLHGCKRDIGARQVASHSPFGEIPLRLWQRLVQAADIFEEQQWAKLPKANLLKLVEQLCRAVFQVSGKGVFKEEFVTCGGVTLNEVNFKTLASRIQPNLYFAGEILDIDGITGGFNFQNAWTTGWIAGQALARD